MKADEKPAGLFFPQKMPCFFPGRKFGLVLPDLPEYFFHLFPLVKMGWVSFLNFIGEQDY
jgi:hypothetical protein